MGANGYTEAEYFFHLLRRHVGFGKDIDKYYVKIKNGCLYVHLPSTLEILGKSFSDVQSINLQNSLKAHEGFIASNQKEYLDGKQKRVWIFRLAKIAHENGIENRIKLRFNRYVTNIINYLKTLAPGQLATSTEIRTALGVTNTSIWKQLLMDEQLIPYQRMSGSKGKKVNWCYSWENIHLETKKKKKKSKKVISTTAPTIKVKQSPTEEAVELALKKRLVDLERDLTNTKKELGQRALFGEELKQYIIKLPPYFSEFKKPIIRREKKPIVAVLEFCDWQIGQRVDLTATGHYGEFNHNLAIDRVLDKLVPKYIKWLESQRHGYVVNNTEIWVKGDMIQGELHETSQMSNEFPVPKQQVLCAQLQAEAIRRIAAYNEHVTVQYAVVDNHSRRTHKYQYDQFAGLNSNNYPIGEMIKAYLADLDNVTINIYLEEQAWIETNGVPFYLWHGHGIKSLLGHPWYAMGHKMGRESMKVLSTAVKMDDQDHYAVHRPFYKYSIGHFHTPMVTQWYMVGGSLPGTCENDSNHGRHHGPAQCAFLVRQGHKMCDKVFNWLEFDLS